MTECIDYETLARLLGEPDLVDRPDIIAHLDRCETCRSSLEQIASSHGEEFTKLVEPWPVTPPLRSVIAQLQSSTP